MTDAEQQACIERFLAATERIAAALEHLHETAQRHLEPQTPPPPEPRQAVVTRVPNREDRIREAQGASDQPLAEWLSEVEDETTEQAFIGRREREWLDAQQPPEKVDRGDQEG